MSKKYYKLVTNGLWSCWITNPCLATRYKIDEFVESPVRGTPLCVFESLQQAEEFRNSVFLSTKYPIYECEVKGIKKSQWIPLITYLPYLTKILKNKKKLNEDMVSRNLPFGTICCREVKLIKKVG